MTDAPRLRRAADLPVHIDSSGALRIAIDGARAVYRWRLTGTHGGTGASVRISGHEEWTLDADGLIANSLGHFDAADYQRQLNATHRGS